MVVDLDNPLAPRVTAALPLNDGRASAIQFRYLWVTDADGLKLFDVTDMAQPRPVPQATVPLADAHRIYLARTYAYVAAGSQGLAIINITRPENPQPGLAGGQMFFTGGEGQVLNDVHDVIVASTNASLFAYVADGRNGLRVLQLTSPEAQPTPSPALSLSKGLDRDRGVDETGHQMAVFGRLGSRPFNRQEQERLFLDRGRSLYQVSDTPNMADWVEARR